MVFVLHNKYLFTKNLEDMQFSTTIVYIMHTFIT